MFDRFTERARKVMGLARQEAVRFNHEYIGTEHVLLGLVKEGSGVAANVLKNLEVELKRSGSRWRSSSERDPNMVTMGGQLPFRRPGPRRSSSSLEEAGNLNTTTWARSTCCSGCSASRKASPPRFS
jgi:ATP-dependent Clp protease ATP-binding subunit ClpC